MYVLIPSLQLQERRSSEVLRERCAAGSAGWTPAIPAAARSYSVSEMAYLEAYNTAMEDRIITPEERKLLNSLATAYSLADTRVEELEAEYNEMLEEE